MWRINYATYNVLTALSPCLTGIDPWKAFAELQGPADFAFIISLCWKSLSKRTRSEL